MEAETDVYEGTYTTICQLFLWYKMLDLADHFNELMIVFWKHTEPHMWVCACHMNAHLCWQPLFDKPHPEENDESATWIFNQGHVGGGW